METITFEQKTKLESEKRCRELVYRLKKSGGKK